jgi:hypothetical protein
LSTDLSHTPSYSNNELLFGVVAQSAVLSPRKHLDRVHPGIFGIVSGKVKGEVSFTLD